MGQRMVRVLQGVLAASLLGSVVVQAGIVPLLAIDMDEADGDLTHLRVPVALLLILAIGAAQVTAVCIWKLVGMVRQGTVFSTGAFRHVDVMIGAAGAAALLMFTLGVVLAPGEAVAPGVVLLIGGVGLVAAGIGLIELVLRTLLAQAISREAEATELRAELDEVI